MAVNTIKNKIIQRLIKGKASLQSQTKGKRLFRVAAYDLQNFDSVKETAHYEVENEFYHTEVYQVHITYFNDIAHINVECSCPQGWNGICKHSVAALLALEQKLGYEIPPSIYYQQAHTEIIMDEIDERILHQYSDSADWLKAVQAAVSGQATIALGTDKNITATVHGHTVKIKKEDNNKFVTSCECNDHDNLLCVHKAIVFMQMKYEKGEDAFEDIRSWDVEKNKLLAQYGYSLGDDLTGKFSFSFQRKKLSLNVLDSTILKISDLTAIGSKYIKKISKKDAPINISNNFVIPIGRKKEKIGIAYVFDFFDTTYMPAFSIIPIIGKLNENTGQLTSKIRPIFGSDNDIPSKQTAIKKLPALDETDVEIFDIIELLSPKNIADFAHQHTNAKLKHDWRHSTYYLPPTGAKNNDLKIIQSYIGDKLNRLFQLLQGKLIYNKFKDSHISAKNIELISPSLKEVKLHFTLQETKDFGEFNAKLSIDDEADFISIKDATLFNNQILKYNKNLYLFKDIDTLETLQVFLKTPSIRVKKESLNTLIKNVALPLKNKFKVEINTDIQIQERKDIVPKAEIFLKESEEFLIVIPIINYDGQQVELDQNLELIYEKDNVLTKIIRNQAFETALTTFMEGLHPTFTEQEQNEGRYYYLAYEQVMENMWFLDFAETLKKEKVELFGFKSLTNFKYNINKPEISFNVSSGIDWFDISGELQFGDQSVSIKDVQKALLRNDRFIRLSDGTLGVLPKEWVQKYASLFKMGEMKGKKLQVSKIHFSLVEELYDLIDDDEVQRELLLKKKKLSKFSEIEKIKIPKRIKAELRDYQKEGFNWLNFLGEFQWGGCLADDMGLGKTLQVLTFLQKQKGNRKAGSKNNLIIAPTTLMFNWENEIQKFCPNLTYYRHHGPNRVRNNFELFKQYDLIITSYGIMTSDIESFSKVKFDYIVLDESQAIKNPSTKRYKAARLLRAGNRIAITGTPIENNTFDLYAQMNFLNPGMLGSTEFFKQEFANPIDKNGDELKVNALKKIVYPFILRRTKGMVAKELPPKTETVLYCEMKGQQRKVYEAFRNEYRFKILDRIDNEGMSKAGMYILEGLMKLRQICNSPLLLKDPEDYGDESIKLNELVNHITEKTGDHKILIFSQFLGMLALIQRQLEAKKIDFSYLDGSTSPNMRQEAVEHFQNKENCRVFLISLKAGSLGLNLTAADYVYLVDPWWNPAVEQQAIDRTHRIGQTKRVFAYKMICKDSVEEKILELQLKKKALAADIISTEKGFLKNLSRNDVAYLFS